MFEEMDPSEFRRTTVNEMAEDEIRRVVRDAVKDALRTTTVKVEVEDAFWLTLRVMASAFVIGLIPWIAFVLFAGALFSGAYK